MRPAALVACLGLAGLLLAGCSSPSKPAAPDPFPPLEVKEGKGLIRGLVVDAALAPVKGAAVHLTNPALDKTTDDAGAFVFTDLDPGTYFLQVSKPGWTSVQQSADVVAGVAEPPIVKVALTKVPGSEPRADTYTQEGFLSCSVGTPANYASCDPGVNANEKAEVYFEVQGVPSAIQTEVRWDSTQPAGDWLYVVQGVCACADGEVPDVGGARFDETADAQSPYIVRVDPGFLDKYDVGAAKDAGMVVVSVSASGPEPDTTNGSGVALNQAFEVYTTFFYNIPEPDASWSFVNNGPYPVPAG